MKLQVYISVIWISERLLEGLSCEDQTKGHLGSSWINLPVSLPIYLSIHFKADVHVHQDLSSGR